MHVSVGIDDGGEMLIGVDNTSLLVDFVFSDDVGIPSDALDLTQSLKSSLPQY